jgi:HD superfamily phosphohydrolase
LDYYLIVDKFSQPVLYKANDKNQTIKLIDKNSRVFSLEEKSQLVNIKQESKKQNYLLIPKEINM